MAHVLTTIADAVVQALNSQFSAQFTAQRMYQPVHTLPELQTLQVSVVPKSVTVAPATRDSQYWDCAVDVGVQQKLAGTDGEVDALLEVVQNLVDFLRSARLPSGQLVSLANEPVVAVEPLDQQRVFTSLVTATYRVRR